MKMKPESQQKLYAALDRVLYQVSQEQLAVHIAAIKPVAKNPVVRLAWDFLHASRVRIEYNARFYNDEPDQIDCDGLVDRHVETVLKHWLVSRGITIWLASAHRANGGYYGSQIKGGRKMKITKAQREMISRVYDKVPWDIVQQSHSKGIKIHDIIINLLSISKSLNKSYCFSCSYPQTDEQEKRRDKREARLEQSAKELAALIGLHCYIQHDPRGYAVHLMSDSDIKYDQIGERYRDVDDYMEHNYYPMAVPLG